MRLLRLAVLINHSRPEQAPELPRLTAENDELIVAFANDDTPSLLMTDLEQEIAFQQAAGFSLRLAQA